MTGSMAQFQMLGNVRHIALDLDDMRIVVAGHPVTRMCRADAATTRTLEHASAAICPKLMRRQMGARALEDLFLLERPMLGRSADAHQPCGAAIGDQDVTRHGGRSIRQ